MNYHTIPFLSGRIKYIDHKEKCVKYCLSILQFLMYNIDNYNKLDNLRDYNRQLRKINNGNKTSTIKA